MIQKSPSPRLFEELLDAIEEHLDPTLAQGLANLQLGDHFHARLQEVSEKCREGQLSADEHEGYQTCVDMLGTLSLLQLRARRYLQSQRDESA